MCVPSAIWDSIAKTQTIRMNLRVLTIQRPGDAPPGKVHHMKAGGQDAIR
jgi:hypothetical protein